MFPNLVHAAIPFFVGSILLEIGISAYIKTKNYHAKDAASSIAMGLGNVFVGILTKGLIFGVYSMVHRFALFNLEYQWWVWVLCFFGDDISYYWYHRKAHTIRYFWASHVIHHSSRYYNLATALRQTWTGGITGSFIFYLWMPLLGFEPLMILFMHSVSLLYQFWIHTEVIKKMPRWFEFIFNTPSHHRVHHSSDLKYLDKNHAGILIIWDRMFGTFEPEIESVKYGLFNNVNTFNPTKITFMGWQQIFKDVRQAKNLNQAMYFFFGPPKTKHEL